MARVKLPNDQWVNIPGEVTPEKIRATAEKLGVQSQPAGAPAQPTKPATPEDAGLADFAARYGPRIAGAAAGAARGAQYGAALGPYGQILSTLAGAGLGGGGAELLKQGWQYLFGSTIGGEEPPETATEALTRSGAAGQEQMVGELVGLTALAGAGRVLQPFVRSVTPRAQEALSFLEPLMKRAEPARGLVRKGVQPATLRPAEATASRSLDILDNIASASVMGGRIRAQDLARQDVLKAWLDDFVDAAGSSMSDSEIGDAFVAAVTKRFEPWQAYTDTLFNTVAKEADERIIGQLAVEHTVDTGLFDAAGKPIARTVVDELPQYVGVSAKAIKKRLAREIRTAKLAAAGGETGENLLRAIDSLPDRITYGDAVALRTKSLRLQREARFRGEDPLPLRRINREFTQQIRTDLEAQAPDLLPVWDKARAATKLSNERFNNKTIQRLSLLAGEKASPQRVVSSLFRRDNLEEIRRVREGTDDATFAKMQRWLLGTIVRKATLTAASAEEAGLPSGARLLNIITGKGSNSIGREVLHETLGPERARAFEQFAKTLELVQARSPEGTGRMLIQLTQGGAILNAARPSASKRQRQAAAVLLIAPNILARIFTNEQMAQLFIKGAKTDYTKIGAARLSGQLLAALNAATKAEAKERAAAQAELSPPQPVAQQPPRQ